MKRRFWTAAEHALLRAEYAHTPTREIAARLGRTDGQVYQQAGKLGLAKSPEYLSQTHGTRAVVVGTASRFRPGQVPWNKGTHFVSGGRSIATRFKPGEMHGAAQHNYRPIGSLRISKNGYLERKVTDDHPVPARRWVAEHRLVWEAVHGPVPAGFAVCFLPGRRTAVLEEITVDALELVSRADLLRRNSLHRHGPEIARLSQLKGAITRQINRRARAEKEAP